MKLEDLTIKEMCSCLAILNKMQQEGIVNVDLKTTTATFNTDKATEYLENQNVELKERINKAIDYMNNTFDITSMREFFNHLDNIENILRGE